MNTIKSSRVTLRVNNAKVLRINAKFSEYFFPMNNKNLMTLTQHIMIYRQAQLCTQRPGPILDSHGKK